MNLQIGKYASQHEPREKDFYFVPISFYSYDKY